MSIGIIKKIAGKLLKQPQTKKPATPRVSKKKQAGPKKTVSEANRKPRRKNPAGGRNRRPCAEQAVPGQSATGSQQKHQERTPESKRPAAKQPQTVNTPATARPVARPPRKNTERGRGRPKRSGSNPRTQRPGGATGDAEKAARLVEHEGWTIDNYQVPPAKDKKRFQDFDLPGEILHGVADQGFQYCTPIQALSLEYALAGQNVAGRAQTGTGKTAAFLVAILTRYLRSPEARQEKGGTPRTLVIAPTRELVIQICQDAAELGKYCRLRSLAVYGGMDYERQKREVSDAPVDLLVATPGRLLDFVRSRVVDLSKVDTLVIDEADRMLDMGFIPDVRKIINRLPPKEKRCTMLYSATLTEDVMRLALQWMEAPVKVEVESEQVTTKSVKQIVYVVTADEKFTVLYNLIQQYPDSRMLIFCNRRSTTEDVAESLTRRNIQCEMLSGDVNQNRRLRVLEDFREGKVRVVVATDVAGRGLHVDDIGFVVNFDFPYEPEDYVHRIGRTGRAGASGTAISFADEDESFTIPEIEKYIGEELKCTVLKEDDPLIGKLPPRPGRGRRPAQAPQKAKPPLKSADTGTREKDRRRTPPRQSAAPAAPAAAPAPNRSAKPPSRRSTPVARDVAPAGRVTKPETRRTVAKPRPPASVSTHAPVKSTPAKSTPVRRPRFSEEWVPGERK